MAQQYSLWPLYGRHVLSRHEGRHAYPVYGDGLNAKHPVLSVQEGPRFALIKFELKQPRFSALLEQHAGGSQDLLLYDLILLRHDYFVVVADALCGSNSGIKNSSKT